LGWAGRPAPRTAPYGPSYGYLPQQPQPWPQQPAPTAAQPAQAGAAWPLPFPLPAGWTLPPAPTGWAIPGLPWPFPPWGAPPATTSTTAPPPTATATTPPVVGALPDARGAELADRINAYRQSRGLPVIARSRGLGITGQTHVGDLERNHPDSGNCNLHSWSSQGAWTSCCYTPDHAQAACMWRKPVEIAGFRGNGYEIAAYTSGTMTPADAVEMWKSSPGHHAAMINDGTWAKSQWRSLGAAVSQHYAVA
jgi:hypothetical protein